MKYLRIITFIFVILAFTDARATDKECNEACPYNYRPVCASDGVTYSNECVMEAEGCINGVELHIVYEGECNQFL